MSELRWEAWAAILAFIITLGYTLYPGPYLTGAFTCIAQPLASCLTCLSIGPPTASR